MNQLTTLPIPHRNHATCAWCRMEFTTIVELIDHVDHGHVTSTRATA
jgi:hypothetical protein